MKKPGLSLLSVIFLFCALNTCFAQSEDDFIFSGPVKTVKIKSETRYYDKTGKMISNISNGNSIKEYYYKEAKEAVLTSYYDIKQPAQKTYEIKQYDTHGKLILTAKTEGDKITDLETYTDQGNHNSFVNNEIYSNSQTKKTSLSTMTFSKEMVPFIWDKELSESTEQSSISYHNPEETNKAQHIIIYNIFEKGNPNNYIKIEFSTDDNDKGYWYRYVNNKIYQERYISNKTNLSGFGHLYVYDKQGRLQNDTYGYFDKIAGGIYMQRKEFSYDNNGNIIKSRELAENAAPFDVNYSYEYDLQKNWTLKVAKYNDGSGTNVSRKIEYYAPNENTVTNNISAADYAALSAKASEQAKIAEQKYKEYLSSNGKPRKTSADPAPGADGWKKFLPAGQILDTVSYGDLNKDGLEDAVIVFQPKKDLQHQRNATRELRILFKQEDGKYVLATSAIHVAMPEDDGNIFFSGTQIKKGVLIVEHEFLRGGCKHIYRYQNGGFYLIGASTIDGDASYTKTFEYNLSTGKYISEYTNDDDNTKSVKKEGVHKMNPLPKIESFEVLSVEVEGEMI